ncbi:MAG: hypothetical protein ACHQQ3_01815 [Gemmatimonadales bacterium]
MMNIRLRNFAVAASALLLVLSGSRVSAQDSVTLRLIKDDATRDVVRSALGRATATGLPVGPLISKALEGIAKRASTATIRGAMAALEKRLRRANALLAPDPTVDELSAGADALSVGVSDRTLKQMRAAAPRRSIALELGVLTELVARGVPRDKASKMVLELMARGANGAQLTALSSAVQADVAAGIKPDVALDLRGRGVMSLLPPSPSASVLQPRSPE